MPNFRPVDLIKQITIKDDVASREGLEELRRELRQLESTLDNDISSLESIASARSSSSSVVFEPSTRPAVPSGEEPGGIATSCSADSLDSVHAGSSSADALPSKRLKIRLRPPTSPAPSLPSSPSPARHARVGKGVKNLSRVKELSRQKVTEDPSRAKADQQIPIGTFWSYVESFFAPVAEEDISGLRDAPLDESLFLIPPLSPASSSQRRTNLRSLSFKIITLLLRENLDGTVEVEDEAPFEGSSGEVAAGGEPNVHSFESIPSIQHRILKELSYVGVPLSSLNLDQHNPVDESFRELKCLQYFLRAVHDINAYRKGLVSDLVKSKMAGQEYYSILDELDRQIESNYTKKYRPLKKKKKNASVDLSAECSELAVLLGKRSHLVKSFSPIILPRSQLSKPPASLFDEAHERELASKYEIPSLSDRQTRAHVNVPELVGKSKVPLWPFSD